MIRKLKDSQIQSLLNLLESGMGYQFNEQKLTNTVIKQK
jgi:hypothetical protein